MGAEDSAEAEVCEAAVKTSIKITTVTTERGGKTTTETTVERDGDGDFDVDVLESVNKISKWIDEFDEFVRKMPKL